MEFPVVSFDVFDTLIFRRCSAESIQYGVANKLGRALGFDSSDTKRVLDERHKAYCDVAKINQNNGLDFEAHLEDINYAWVKRLTPDTPDKWSSLSKLACFLKRKYEQWSCYPNPKITDLLQYLCENNHQLIYISDMYLGQDIINDILNRAGLLCYFHNGYVSGDHSLLKNTGRLYDYVLEDLGLTPEKLLHIGDNPYADGVKAAEKGITSLVIGEQIPKIRRAQFNTFFSYAYPSWSGCEAADFVSSETHCHKLPGLQFLGRDILGPVFSAYIHGLVEFCQHTKPDAVYFISREGLLLKDLYNTLMHRLHVDLPEGNYLCSSRLAASISSMRGYGLREISSKVVSNGKVSLRRLLKVLNFSEEELLHLARSHGVQDVDKEVSVTETPSFSLLVNHPVIQERAAALGAISRREFIQYLQTTGFFETERVLLVDVGWAGQISEGIQIALEDIDSPEIFTYYLGANSKAIDRIGAGIPIYADFFNSGRFEWLGSSSQHFVFLIEIASRAAHGTITGYKNGQPVMLDEDHSERIPEIEDDTRLAQLQQGIRDFMKLYAQYAAIKGSDAKSLMSYSRCVIARLIFMPRTNELNLLSSFTNVANFGSSDKAYFSTTPPLFPPSAFLTSVSKSLWRQGAVAMALGRIASLAYTVLSAPRVCRNLPNQNNLDLPAARKQSNTSTPLPPFEHKFEKAVLDKQFRLFTLGCAQSQKVSPKPPLYIYELLLLKICFGLSNIYLRSKGMNTFTADFISFKLLLGRKIYAALPENLPFRNFAVRCTKKFMSYCK
ncbi:HAD family hydrolase [Desulfopila aestuarii]|nr:HAD family hydrolase [Desulfopila aestuarii]